MTGSTKLNARSGWQTWGYQMNTKLIHLINEALDLNLEVGATLLDDDLRDLERQAQEAQVEVQGKLDEICSEIDRAFTKLQHKATWKNDDLFGQTLKSLLTHFMQMRKYLVRQQQLEELEDSLKAERIGRTGKARDLNREEATIIEETYSEICSFSGKAVA